LSKQTRRSHDHAPTDTSIRTSIVVEAPIERAFSVFTDDIGSWWDPKHHILGAELAEMVFEPQEGGYVYDRSVDGSECRWARVLAYDPPKRLVISWDINTQWQLETDLQKTSEKRCGSSQRPPSGRASSSSIGTSAATARVGRRCGTRSDPRTAGAPACGPSPGGWRAERRDCSERPRIQIAGARVEARGPLTAAPCRP